jgi:hypothetical protein
MRRTEICWYRGMLETGGGACSQASAWLPVAGKPRNDEKVVASVFRSSTTLSWSCEEFPELVINKPGCWCWEQLESSGESWPD